MKNALRRAYRRKGEYMGNKTTEFSLVGLSALLEEHGFRITAGKENYRRVEAKELNLTRFFVDGIETGLPESSYETAEDLYKHFLEYYNITKEDAKRVGILQQGFVYLLQRNYLIGNYMLKKTDGKPVPCFSGIKLKRFVKQSKLPIAEAHRQVRVTESIELTIEVADAETTSTM